MTTDMWTTDTTAATARGDLHRRELHAVLHTNMPAQVASHVPLSADRCDVWEMWDGHSMYLSGVSCLSCSGMDGGTKSGSMVGCVMATGADSVYSHCVARQCCSVWPSLRLAVPADLCYTPSAC